MTIVNIRSEMREAAFSALDKLVRRATKAGVQGVGYSVVREWVEAKVRTDFYGFDRTWMINWTELDVTAAPVQIGDHTFMAKLEVSPDGTLVDRVPNAGDLDPKWMTWGGDCEHCKVKRTRKHLFVVADKDGKQMAVGKSCLRLFMGTDVPAAVAAAFSFWSDVGSVFNGDEDSPYRSAGAGRTSYHLETVLALTAVAARLYGWGSKSQAMKDGTLTPTVSYVDLGLNERPNDKHEGKVWDRLRESHAEADNATAQSVIAWVRDEMPGTNEYAHNLRVLFADTAVSGNRLGIVVSAWAQWANAMDRAKTGLTSATPSQHVGPIGTRLRGIAVTYEDSIAVGSNEYGPTILVKFKTLDGNVLKWFTGKGVDAQRGEKLTLTGTVKRHERYNGDNETILSRCVIDSAENKD